LKLQKSTTEAYSVFGDGEVKSLQGKTGYIHVYPVENGVEYLYSTSKKQNVVSFFVDATGYTVHQDGSLLTELPERDYIVWTETYAWDGENETRKDISLVGCLRFIPDGSITESVIIKRPYIYDFTGRGVWGTQTFDNGVLTVIIPQDFVDSATYPIFVDPTTIFSAGFESGDFSGWTGTVGTPATSGSPVHHGDYSMVNNGSEMVYYTFSTHDARACRTYVYFEGTPTDRVCILGFRNEYEQEIPYVEIYPNSGLKYRLFYKNTSNNIVTSEASATFVEDTWYCFELFADKTNNDVEFWVNGVSTISVNDQMDEVTTGFYCGTRHFLGSTFNVFTDCCVLADGYIGPETSGPESLAVELSSPTNATTVTSYSQTFTYTPTIIGSDSIQNASLYIDNSLVASNSTAITNATANGIAYNFTSNGEYEWTVGVWNTTHLVFPSSNFTLTVAVNESLATPTATPEPSVPVTGPISEFTYKIVFQIKNGTNSVKDAMVKLGILTKTTNQTGHAVFNSIAKGTYNIVVFSGGAPVYDSSVVIKFDSNFIVNIGTDEPPEIEPTTTPSPTFSAPFGTSPPIFDLSNLQVSSSWFWVGVPVVLLVLAVLFFGAKDRNKYYRRKKQ
jgi:hypothetical protein